MFTIPCERHTSPPYKVKREEVGTFDPDWPDPEDLGTVLDRKNIIFTDINSFSDRIDSFVEDGDTTTSKQLMKIFQTLFGGPAIIW